MDTEKIIPITSPLQMRMVCQYLVKSFRSISLLR